MLMGGMFVPLRRGKWTPEEEVYVDKIIQCFNDGTLQAPPGVTLRAYLSKQLHCDPMRITKKFSGTTSIGKVRVGYVEYVTLPPQPTRHLFLRHQLQ